MALTAPIRKRTILAAVTERVILADGAMGTEIYRRGVLPRESYDGLNLTRPDLIRAVHEDYLRAGAELLESNTFGANRVKLARYQLDRQVAEINYKGVEIARLAAEKSGKSESVFIGGSIGPIARFPNSLDRVSATEAFAEQLDALCAASPDLLVFESFGVLEELELALRLARARTTLPILAQFRFELNEAGAPINADPEAVGKRLEGAGADLIGANCGPGPDGLFPLVERLKSAINKPLVVMPNAGMPRLIADEGRMLYPGTPQTFATWGRRFWRLGARLLGGCCGTTPDMIRELGAYLRGVDAEARSQGLLAVIEAAREKRSIQLSATPTFEKTGFSRLLGKRFLISVELDSPLGVDPSRELAGARMLKESGVDAINIADNPRAIPRMNAESLAFLMKQEIGIETIVHVCGRDRNWFRLQSDFLGLNAAGLRNVIIITGDPPKSGDGPPVTAVFDLDAIGILGLADLLNRGLDLTGKPLKGKTDLFLGCGVDPGALNAARETDRLRRKIAAGAEAVFSQPVYDPELLEAFLTRNADVLTVPFFVGILPLASAKNADFLHHNVPGMRIPEEILKRMHGGGDPKAQAEEGLRIAREALFRARVHPLVKGAYIMPPFNRAESALRVIEGLPRTFD